MLTKKTVIALLLLAVTFSVTAQKEQNNWFFGYNAGLTWNTTRSFTATGMLGAANTTLTGIPTVVTDSKMTTYEGCFSLSDANGNLLFFSDGITIWDKTKGPMLDGGTLTGNPSSAQSGVILPYPGSLTRYVAITLGSRDANNLSYTIVNMSLGTAGRGAVEVSPINNKNQAFTGQLGTLGESVTAVRHSNKNDFWVIAVGRAATATTTAFNVWKITEAAGIQKARHSVASVTHTTTAVVGADGYIKFTQDGKRFVWINFNTLAFVYGDFNPTTGIISNLKVRTGAGPTNGRGYGIEFSPSGKYLYLTYAPGSTNQTGVNTSIDIYDTDALWAASNPNTVNYVRRFLLPTGTSDGKSDLFAGIQLGPDNRMYISAFFTSNIFILPNPDTPTTTSLYKLTNVLGAGATSYWGLPSFAAPWFKMLITLPEKAECCSEYTTNFPLTIENGMGFSAVTRIVIDFGDGAPNSTTTINSPTLGTAIYSYKYKKPGTYTITVTAYNASSGVELTQTASVKVNSCALKVNKHIRSINN
ncbi:hypothetical protein CLV62_101193 [Dysgonomonas alginatilytica]|uniref:PKD domain-containing protein n=1 Tax=Dysgonomonas alginatilytica TaxID=1605892 RepID=A0A2V3PT69_9BACT|nr:PKD domain-containing protein [Dysgonomonas alginatilytica]PXV68927.1 hypothetical protein CLV62_101193 [Dysgonomonas alginatilytica]